MYAVGGSNRDDGTRSNLNSMERYNPEKDEWEDLPPMHRSRGAASVTALKGCLYAVGGYDSGKSLPCIRCCVRDLVFFIQANGCVKWNALIQSPISGVSSPQCYTVEQEWQLLQLEVSYCIYKY